MYHLHTVLIELIVRFHPACFSQNFEQQSECSYTVLPKELKKANITGESFEIAFFGVCFYKKDKAAKISHIYKFSELQRSFVFSFGSD